MHSGVINNKKGITGVMIVILLVALFLSGGIFTYFFYFGPKVKEEVCDLQLGWRIAEVDGKKDVCYNQQKQEIRFTVENGAAIPMQALYVKFSAKEGRDTLILETRLDPAAVFIGKVPFNGVSQGPFIKMELLPIVDLDGEATACLDEVLEIDGLVNCSR